MLDRLAKYSHFCYFDGYLGFHQIPIHPLDQQRTTFTCLYGTFAYRKMFFGLYNALATFQSIAPIAKSIASHITSKGKFQLGGCNIEVEISASFNLQKAFRQEESKLKGTSFTSRLDSGLAILEKSLMKRIFESRKSQGRTPNGHLGRSMARNCSSNYCSAYWKIKGSRSIIVHSISKSPSRSFPSREDLSKQRKLLQEKIELMKIENEIIK
ncbi:hypothetical protein CR513_44253, partial [Mucuna pruriens]